MFKRTILLSLSALSTLMAAGYTQAGAPVGSWYVAPQMLWVSPDGKRGVDSAFGYRVAAGTAVSQAWDAEIGYAETRHSNSDNAGSAGDLKFSDVEVDLKRIVDRDARVNPFLDLGLGILRSAYKSGSANDGSRLAPKLGFGVLMALGQSNYTRAQVVADLGLRLDGTKNTGNGLDPYVGLGLRFNFGGSAPVAATPVAAVAAPMAAAAPPPPPAPVDSDGDGVIDNLDKCPNTVAGAKVDANGCELDGDHDGVVDRLDRCPTTPAGDKVDEVGCSLTMALQVNFDTDSANIKADSYVELDRFVGFLKAVPSARGELQGHTDSVGKDSYNLKLSQRRADAVMAYVVGKGIDANRMTAKGYGETQPVGDNKTAEGRAQNRRVLFVRSAGN